MVRIPVQKMGDQLGWGCETLSFWGLHINLEVADQWTVGLFLFADTHIFSINDKIYIQICIFGFS